MTVATASVALAPKPVRKRRTRAKSVTTKTMTEQKVTTITPIKEAVVVNEPVKLTKPDVDIIPIQKYIDDFNNRMLHHNYEVQEALSDLKFVVNKARPYAQQVINKVKDMTS